MGDIPFVISVLGSRAILGNVGCYYSGMPQQYIPVNFRQIGSALFNWQLLPAFLGMVAITKSVFDAEVVSQKKRAGEDLPDKNLSRRGGWAPQRGDDYLTRLNKAWETADWSQVEGLGLALQACWREGAQVFLCGNGGSASNAIHMANDLIYGIDKPAGQGMRAIALPANTSVLTCLGNDTSYAEIYSRQLRVMAVPGDLLVVLSGSGNSPNILEALREAKRRGMVSYAILGYKGGAAAELADHVIHFAVEDMQIAEDLQMMIVHFLTKWLHDYRGSSSVAI